MRDPKSFQIRFARLSRIRFTAICFSVAVRCVAHRDSHIYIVTNRMKVDSLLGSLYRMQFSIYVYIKCTHYIRMDCSTRAVCLCVALLLLKVLRSRFSPVSLYRRLAHSVDRTRRILLRTLANISNCISYMCVCVYGLCVWWRFFVCLSRHNPSCCCVRHGIRFGIAS